MYNTSLLRILYSLLQTYIYSTRPYTRPEMKLSDEYRLYFVVFCSIILHKDN